MKKTLTLQLDESLIQRAEAFAHAQGKPVSELVESYFAELDEEASDVPSQAASTNGSMEEDMPRKGYRDEDLPPIVRSLKGCIKGSGVDIKDYYRYLEEKYL